MTRGSRNGPRSRRQPTRPTATSAPVLITSELQRDQLAGLMRENERSAIKETTRQQYNAKIKQFETFCNDYQHDFKEPTDHTIEIIKLFITKIADIDNRKVRS